MSDLCVLCDRKVSSRQHAVSCDGCERWQHRLCDTGISRDDYLKMTKGKLDLQFLCTNCRPSMSSTMIQTSVASTPERGMITFALDLSMGEEPPSVTSVPDESVSVAQTSVPSTPGLGVTFALSLNMEDTQDTTDESANVAPAPRAPFDVTRHEPANASTLDEGHIGNPALSATVLGEEELTFHILEAGTERRGRKLVSSDGYSYCVKKVSSSSTTWRCSVRRKDNICYSSVTQRGDIFTRGTSRHNHPADALMLKKVTIKRDLRLAAHSDKHATAGQLVRKQLTDNFVQGEFNLLLPKTLARQVNRARQKMRPADPTSLEFEIDTEYLGDPFLNSLMGSNCHLFFKMGVE